MKKEYDHVKHMHIYLYRNEQCVGDPTHDTQLTYVCAACIISTLVWHKSCLLPSLFLVPS